MASISPIRARGLGCLALAAESSLEFAQPRGAQIRISSLCYNAGLSARLWRTACEGVRHRCSYRPTTAVVWAAVSKQKKKTKEKKRSSPGGSKQQWKFDELMLLWDDVFEKVCEDASVSTTLYELSQNGFSQHGQGCVLLQEFVNTRPRGAASGFSFKSRYSSSGSPEVPTYSSVRWTAEYVPKEFILDPSKAPESSADSPDAPMADDVVQVVNKGTLRSVLVGMDKTRLLGLLAGPESQDPANSGARDVGGEEPYNPANDELVIMLAVSVDKQLAVGADVLKAYPTVEDGVSSSTASLWTLQLRDELPD